MRQVFASILVVLALAGVGCKKPYVEIQPMNEKLSHWNTMSIELIPQTNDEDLRAFEEALNRRARAEHYLPMRDPATADLRMRVVIMDFEAGDAVNAAWATVDVDFLDVKRNIVVGRFKVTRKTSDSLSLDPEGRATLMLRGIENVIFSWLREHAD